MYLYIFAWLTVVWAQEPGPDNSLPDDNTDQPFVDVNDRTPLSWSAYVIDPTTPRPTPRREAISGYDPTRNVVFMFGGRTVDEDGQTDQIFNDTWVLDLNVMLWTRIYTYVQPPPTFAGVGGIITEDDSENGGWLVIATGDQGDERTDSVWVFPLSAFDESSFDDENIQRWFELDTYGEMPKPRYGSSGGTSGDTLYLTHGFDDVRFSDTYSLDLEPLVRSGPRAPCAWKHIHDGSYEYAYDHPHSRSAAASTVTDSGFIVMFGGCLTGGKYGGPCPSRDSWVYWIDDGWWHWTMDGPGQSMFGSMTPIENEDVLLWGGQADSRQLMEYKQLGDQVIHVLTPLSGGWRRYQVEVEGNPDLALPAPRRSPAIFATMRPRLGDSIVMWGGDGDDADKLEHVYILSGNLTDTTPLSIGWYWWTFWHIHGIFMFASWGIILQLGVCFARYGKRGGRTWFYAHTGCQAFGLIVAIIGLILGFISAGAINLNPNFAHSVAGIFILIFMVIQPINGILRAGRSSSKYWVWQLLHKAIGWFLVLLSLVNIILGCFLALLNRLAWAAIAWAIVVLLGHLILTLLGFAKDDSKNDGADYSSIDEGVFRTSEVFKAGTKGGTSALYQ